jgi:hypothetical protein
MRDQLEMLLNTRLEAAHLTSKCTQTLALLKTLLPIHNSHTQQLGVGKTRLIRPNRSALIWAVFVPIFVGSG